MHSYIHNKQTAYCLINNHFCFDENIVNINEQLMSELTKQMIYGESYEYLFRYVGFLLNCVYIIVQQSRIFVLSFVGTATHHQLSVVGIATINCLVLLKR